MTKPLSLTGADAGLFGIVNNTDLMLNGPLDFATNPSLDVTVEVDDTSIGAGPDDTASMTITITEAGGYVLNLQGSNSNEGRNWTAIMDVQVTSGGSPVNGAVIAGTPNEGQCDQVPCTCTKGTTGTPGQCSLSASGIRKNIGSMDFTVDTVNGEPDGSSITIFKP